MVKIPVADPGREHYEELLKWVRVGATAAGYNPDDYMIGGEAQGLELCITNKAQDLYLTMGEYIPDGPSTAEDIISPTFILGALVTADPDWQDVLISGTCAGIVVAVEQFLTHPLRDQIQGALIAYMEGTR